ncbi:KRAB-A domain-containing protein 2-like [Palaemon carinicauda]|uniref:KRAB-A domain-containing protein 2-like n=1 Tax=Palaemon carinicauda TaxID=392227 RepID=UPI0035B63724
MSESIELKFREELFSRYEKCSKYLIPKDAYFQMIEDIHRARERKITKSHYEFYLMSKYEVLQCGDVEKIIKKRQTLDKTPVYYVSIEDTFDIVKRAHVATGHGGRDRMTKELQVKYDNIQRDTIELFKSLCLECQKKRKRPMTKGVVVKPIPTQIITELRSLWPELSIVHGKPRHPQSQGSIERANGDIKDMLVAWMADNNSTDWATGIKLVQFSKNLAYHAGIKRSPHAAMFDVNTRVGLTSTSLPQEIISCLQSEQDLITTLQQQETDANEPEAEADVNEPEREPPKAEMNESEQEPSHNPRIKRTLINFITASAPSK